MSNNRITCLLVVTMAFVPFGSAQTPWNSDLVEVNQNGRLEYHPDQYGNRIPDFSYAGYRNGMEPIPDVPVVMEIEPVVGDNTNHIQIAINTVEAMPLDGDGLRGALLLKAGIYPVSGTLVINSSGVILRGVGDDSDSTSNTIIWATGNSPAKRTVVSAGGGEVKLWGSNLPEPKVDIVSDTVLAGDRRFQVADPAVFNVGDNIIIVHPCTDTWLASIDYGGTHSGEGDWEPGVDIPWEVDSQPIYFNRYIEAIDGNTITVDVPIFNTLIRSLSQAYVYAWDGVGLVTQVGIENLRIDIENTGGTDEEHAENGIVLYEIEDSWVRNCTVLHFILSGIETGMATRVTIDSCRALDPVSVIEGGKRYNFNLYRYSQQVLTKDCHASNGRHHYISNGTSSTSGCVFLNCTSSGAYTSSEGHRRWSQGLLWDNHQELDGPRAGLNPRLLGLYCRGYYGTSHGWGLVNSVAWNCDVADGDLIVQNPPGGQNYAIGCSGANITGKKPPASFDEPEGYVEGENTSGLEPVSLYLAQLNQRKNPLPAYTVNLSFDGSGTARITPDPIGGKYDSSTVITIEADPAEHWHFKGWTGDIQSNENPVRMEINSDLNIVVDFDSIATRYNLDVQINGSGAVKQTPESESGLYDSSAVVELYAVPAPHWRFSGWSGAIVELENPVEVQINSDLQVVATFDSIETQYYLDITVDGNGTVTVEPEPYNGTYDFGQIVYLTAQPDSGWELLRWQGDLTGNSSADSLLMDSDKSVTASFGYIPVGSMVIDTSWNLASAVEYLNTHEQVDTLILGSTGCYVSTDSLPLRVRTPMVIKAAGGLAERPVIQYLESDADRQDLFQLFASFTIEGIRLDGGAAILNAVNLVNIDDLVVPAGVDIAVNDCEIFNFNLAGVPLENGHGFHMEREVAAGNLRIENTIFTSINGAAIDISETQNWETFSVLDSLVVRNCTFNTIGAECLNYWSDDLPFTADAPVLIEHLTIYNSAQRSILIMESNNAVVRDLIIANTIPGTTGNLLEVVGTGASVSNIDTFRVANLPIVVSGGILDESKIYGFDPLFADAANGDFTLLPGSPVYGLAHDGGALGDARWAANPPVTVDESQFLIPVAYNLKQNYPNPFNPVTMIEYDLPEDSHVKLIILDIMGRQITKLVDESQNAGYKSVQWNGRNTFGQLVSAGIYLYSIETGSHSAIQKMVLLK